MAARTKVTIQDIADELGISRNTVSKAINNTGILADSTRERILKKAQEMGYKQFSYLAVTDTSKISLLLPGSEEKREIALIAGKLITGSHFASMMMDKFQRELAQLGYTLTIQHVIPDEIAARKLPVSFHKERTAGIVCVEIFDYPYAKMLCGLNIPTLFIDSPADCGEEPLEADRLYMDNQTEIFRFIREMARRGRNRIGFIGDYLHCRSFYERYMAYRNALFTLGLPCRSEYCITNAPKDTDAAVNEEYRSFLANCFGRLKKLPDVFICANDFVALDTVHALKRIGRSVPDDVLLCGFDDSPESKVMTPSLTTIHIHSQVMGFSAVQLLMSRIKEPSLNYRTLYTETNLILRESTKD